jgi:hypothetical protein
MAINQNHLFEELNGVKCAIVEKTATKERVEFLKQILEYNHYTVIVVPSPPSKVIPPKPSSPAVSETDTATGSTPPILAGAPAPAPETFTIGVTDVGFNPINAIFGRLLKSPGGHIVTLAYWRQKENEPDDEVPYFEGKK